MTGARISRCRERDRLLADYIRALADYHNEHSRLLEEMPFERASELSMPLHDVARCAFELLRAHQLQHGCELTSYPEL